MGRPRERRPLFGGVYVLVPIWLGAPRPAWRPDPLLSMGPAGFLGRYLVTVYHRETIRTAAVCFTFDWPLLQLALVFKVFLHAAAGAYPRAAAGARHEESNLEPRQLGHCCRGGPPSRAHGGVRRR